MSIVVIIVKIGLSLVAIVLAVLAAVLASIPVLVYYFVDFGLSPEGFWQELIFLCLGVIYVIVLGVLQIIFAALFALFALAIVYVMIEIWVELY